ncbi:MAG: helix-turn-helix domain-containing protein [Betaproteobacteria bacterium]|nr:helix-turn-helix domain-containing protein [Betaproteobacteria bacterium]
MLNGAQIKMARAALNWSVSKLAVNSSVSISTIKRMESEIGEYSTTAANLKLIRETLEAAGVEFIGSAGEGPGVRLWRR